MVGLNTLKDKDDFAKLLGYRDAKYINYLLYRVRTDNLYTSFSISKKSGGTRLIHAPKPELKLLQRKLAKALWKCYSNTLRLKSGDRNVKLPIVSHGFEKNKSIITNAMQHRNKKFILNIDLENFFDSFNFGRVRGFFIKDRNFATSSEIATMIAQIACYQGKLPQGAPSSPIITNLITRILDYRIVKIAKKYRFTYTRYADDMTFSTNRDLFSNKLQAYNELDRFLEEVEAAILSSGFKINKKKTRLSNAQQRQEVTGLVVNRKISVKREFVKNTRAMAFKLYKDGFFKVDGRLGTLEQLTGRFAFIFQLSIYNNYLLYKKSLTRNNVGYQRYLLPQGLFKKSNSEYYQKYIFYNQDLRSELFFNTEHKKYNLPKEFYSITKEEKKGYMALLDSKEKEYKKFLFYKYFFGNEKPMIVTEGKTGPRYIKAALKSLYIRYPELVEKVGNNFHYKIDFLTHSQTIEYLFNVPEGGEGFKYWYNYFSDKNFNMKDNAPYKSLYKNYMAYFRELTGRVPANPTMFLFDNETVGHPLYQFADYAKDLQIDSNNLNQIRKPMLNYRTNQQSSLYLMSTPLVAGQNSSDIEDVLKSKNSFPILKKLSFNKNGGRGYYGKEVLSKYVLKNHRQFDFSGFIPLLDRIRDNILEYRNS